MREVTIDIPAEHVETVRRHLSISIGQAGEPLDGFADSPDAVRGPVAKVQTLAAMMDQISWEGDSEAVSLTADVALLEPLLGDALQYAKDDVGDAEGAELDGLMWRIKWLSETLDSFEPEKVGAA